MESRTQVPVVFIDDLPSVSISPLRATRAVLPTDEFAWVRVGGEDFKLRLHQREKTDARSAVFLFSVSAWVRAKSAKTLAARDQTIGMLSVLQRCWNSLSDRAYVAVASR